MRKYLRTMMLFGLLLFPFILIGCGSNPTTNTSEDSVVKEEQVETKLIEMKVPEGVPVLMYHMIGPQLDNDAVISEENFTEQMEFLANNNFNPISLDELYEYLTEGAPLPINPVVLTFDDGYVDTYTIAFPLMQKHNFKATLFMPTADIGIEDRVGWEELIEMDQNNFKVFSHSHKHEEITSFDLEGKIKDISTVQKLLEEKLGHKNEFHCYPYGDYDEESIKILNDYGIKLAVTMNPGWVHQGDNLMTLNRIWIGNPVDIENFAERVQTENYASR